MYYIYTLRKDKDVFYIGKTNNIHKRFKNHKINLGENILMEILDIVEDWRFWETYWIQQFKTWGFNLVNKNDGGGGVNFHSQKTKLLISSKLKGKQKQRNSETNKKIS